MSATPSFLLVPVPAMTSTAVPVQTSFSTPSGVLPTNTPTSDAANDTDASSKLPLQGLADNQNSATTSTNTAIETKSVGGIVSVISEAPDESSTSNSTSLNSNETPAVSINSPQHPTTVQNTSSVATEEGPGALPTPTTPALGTSVSDDLPVQTAIPVTRNQTSLVPGFPISDISSSSTIDTQQVSSQEVTPTESGAFPESAVSVSAIETDTNIPDTQATSETSTFDGKTISSRFRPRRTSAARFTTDAGPLTSVVPTNSRVAPQSSLQPPASPPPQSAPKDTISDADILAQAAKNATLAGNAPLKGKVFSAVGGTFPSVDASNLQNDGPTIPFQIIIPFSVILLLAIGLTTCLCLRRRRKAKDVERASDAVWYPPAAAHNSSRRNSTEGFLAHSSSRRGSDASDASPSKQSLSGTLNSMRMSLMASVFSLKPDDADEETDNIFKTTSRAVSAHDSTVSGTGSDTVSRGSRESQKIVFGCLSHNGHKWPTAKASGGRWVWIGGNERVFTGEVDEEEDVQILRSVGKARAVYNDELLFWRDPPTSYSDNWSLLFAFFEQQGKL
ncbi:hypothetical protein HDU81_008217 [Chytriomyces hyalinus]|nr:hypothetical protein HDU81_008217 [Chytriomyces hyalinus]